MPVSSSRAVFRYHLENLLRVSLSCIWLIASDAKTLPPGSHPLGIDPFYRMQLYYIANVSYINYCSYFWAMRNTRVKK